MISRDIEKVFVKIQYLFISTFLTKWIYKEHTLAYKGHM